MKAKSKKQPTVLLTGSTGFIGNYVLPLLLDKAYKVYSLTHTSKTPVVAGSDLIHCDLLSKGDTSAVIREIKPEYLMHLAWDVKPGYLNADSNLVWMDASAHLVREFAKYGGKKAVIAGTCFEYGSNCDEYSTTSRPNSVYGICKNSLHELLITLPDTRNLLLAWGRIFYLYGPYEHPSRLVPSVINSLLNNEKVILRGSGKTYSSYLYVGDVANAFVTALSSTLVGAFNISGINGTDYYMADVVKKIHELMDRDNETTYGTESAYDKCGTSNHLKTYGWDPKMSLERGLIHTINWWRAQGRVAI